MKITEKRQQLLDMAKADISKFCEINGIKQPDIIVEEKFYDTTKGCGWYEFGKYQLHIVPSACANEVDKPGWGWSHPHYFVDRTCYGALIHEFGHYIHDILGLPNMPKGPSITSYEPNKYERFAETIKLFVSNPDLLKNYNKKRYDKLISLGLKPIYSCSWDDLLKNADKKYIDACINRIKK